MPARSNRLLKKAQLRRWFVSALAATYLQYAWTQRTGYPASGKPPCTWTFLSGLGEMIFSTPCWPGDETWDRMRRKLGDVLKGLGVAEK